MSTADDHAMWATARAEELAELKRRHPKRADVEKNLVGLAFSGGGIRSATFGLGVLEGLKRLGLLLRVDYLSTVSGGGYIGAWFSANCRRTAGWAKADADWNKSVAHLRRYSNYLSPKLGFFSADTWSMFTVWMRNTLLIQATVILAIACALLLPRPLFEVFQHWPAAHDWRWATIFLFVLSVVGIAGNQLRQSSGRQIKFLNSAYWLRGLIAGGICAGLAWAYGAYEDFDPFLRGETNYLVAGPIAMLLVLAGFCLQPVVLRIVNVFWPAEKTTAPEEINYTQNWVQAVVVIPLMATGVLVAAILWGESQPNSAASIGLDRFDTFGLFLTEAWKYWPFPLSVLFASVWLLSFCSIRGTWNWKGLAAAFLAPFVAVPALHALFCAIMLLLHTWAKDPATGAWHAFVWAPALVLYAFSLTIVVLIGMMGRESTEGVREWWSRLGAWLLIYGFAWMVIALPAVYGPYSVRWVASTHPWTSMSVGGGWLGTVIAGLFAGQSESTNGGPKKKSRNKVLEVLARIAPFVFIGGLLIGVSAVVDEVVRLNTGGQDWSSIGALGHVHPSPFLFVSLVLWAVCVVTLLVLAARVDINEFSLNAFYRSRLVRCYLGATRFREGERRPQNFTGFDDDDDVALAGLISNDKDPKAGAPPGPLHIVNCALNLGGSSDLALHTRHSAAFTLTPLRCGSAYESRDQTGTTRQLGYVPTRSFGGDSGAPTLGQAIAVSGAAASPNMGYHTSPVVAFLLTVFNVRLGWWFPNPGQSDAKYPSPHFSLSYLIAELFGGATDKSKYVMVSDGGHFENLAAYELVRRQCRVIIISDGECDSGLTFEGLGTLIRMCEVDFGTSIEIDLAAIRRKDDATWSRRRHAIGRIVYGNGVPDGVLIYLKASMTGREDTPVLQYKSSHGDFPHETTGDQFYGEDQFESYRNLGREVAAEATARLAGLPDDLIEMALRLLDAPQERVESA